MADYVDAVARARANPGSFEVPLPSLLARLAPGDRIKVCANDCERFWVLVTSIAGSGPDRRFTGRVINILVCSDEHQLACNDQVTVEARHIYAMLQTIPVSLH